MIKKLGERRMANVLERFQRKRLKKLMGNKIRTLLSPHKISVKFYENGITIKPKTEGYWEEEMFLTNENAKILLDYLQFIFNAKSIADNFLARDT